MKLGEITLNGKQVSVFAPPHDEPDFPWVDVEELAKAYLPRAEARRIAAMTKDFGKGQRTYSTAKNGDRISMIICHAMAHGLVGMIDFKNGHRGEPEDGNAHREYSIALGKFTADRTPMTLDAMFYAFKNPGGKYLRDLKL